MINRLVTLGKSCIFQIKCMSNFLFSCSTLKNGIAVGSAHSYSTDLTDSMLGPGYISYYSSRGPTLDGRTKPDILAPGHYISSSAAGESCDGLDPAEPYHKTEGLISYAGTSMATPITAATAGLVRQYLAEGYYPSGKPNEDDAVLNPSASLIKAILLNGGQDMFGVDNGSDGVFPVMPYDNIQNMGRLSLVDSLYLEDESNVQVEFWDRQSIEEGDILSFSKVCYVSFLMHFYDLSFFFDIFRPLIRLVVVAILYFQLW